MSARLRVLVVAAMAHAATAQTRPPQTTARICAADPDILGNGLCNSQVHSGANTELCGWDGGDCCEETCVSSRNHTCGELGYPQCRDPNACDVSDLNRVGDATCDRFDNYNTAACDWDGGDCCASTCVDTNTTRCGVVNNVTVDFLFCADPQFCVADEVGESDRVGDALCDPLYNVASCDWDGGDCCYLTCVDTELNECGVDSENRTVGFDNCDNPDICQVSDHSELGDGHCDTRGGLHNTEACDWDGGDCCAHTCNNASVCGLSATGSYIGFYQCRDPIIPEGLGNCTAETLVNYGDGICNSNGDATESSRRRALDLDNGRDYGYFSIDPVYYWSWYEWSYDYGLYSSYYYRPRYDYYSSYNGYSYPYTYYYSYYYYGSYYEYSYYSYYGEFNLNTAACNWDGGDCCSQTCELSVCVGGSFDCQDPGALEPVDRAECVVELYSFLGDGYCDLDGDYNTAACNWDGGDCCEETCEDTVPYQCDDTTYNCLDPDAESFGECPTIPDSRFVRGNGVCDVGGDDLLNTEVCDWDGGDCCPSTCDTNATDPTSPECGNYFYTCLNPAAPDYGTAGECEVDTPSYLNDGYCDLTGGYNTDVCGWDAGDCCASTCVTSEYTCGARQYHCLNPEAEENLMENTTCTAFPLSFIGDGYCDGNASTFNNEQCGWDGGDCCYRSCRHGEQYDCGYVYNDFGTLVFSGYRDCLDPDNQPTTTTTTTTTTTRRTPPPTTTAEPTTTTIFALDCNSNPEGCMTFTSDSWAYGVCQAWVATTLQSERDTMFREAFADVMADYGFNYSWDQVFYPDPSVTVCGSITATLPVQESARATLEEIFTEGEEVQLDDSRPPVRFALAASPTNPITTTIVATTTTTGDNGGVGLGVKEGEGTGPDGALIGGAAGGAVVLIIIIIVVVVVVVNQKKKKEVNSANGPSNHHVAPAGDDGDADFHPDGYTHEKADFPEGDDAVAVTMLKNKNPRESEAGGSGGGGGGDSEPASMEMTGETGVEKGGQEQQEEEEEAPPMPQQEQEEEGGGGGAAASSASGQGGSAAPSLPESTRAEGF